MTQIPQVPRHRTHAAAAHSSEAASDSWLAVPDFTLVAQVRACTTIAAETAAPSAPLDDSTRIEAIDRPVPDAPLLDVSQPVVASVSESTTAGDSPWPLDVAVEVHPERPGLKPVLANLGSYTGLVGHLVRMSTADWRRTIVVVGVGSLALLSWMKSGSSPGTVRSSDGPQVTAVPDVSSIKQLGQEPLRAPKTERPSVSVEPSATRSQPTVTPPTKPVDDSDLFHVKSLETTAPPEDEAPNASDESPRSVWPTFKSPSGSKVGQSKAAGNSRDELVDERVSRRARSSRWSRFEDEPTDESDSLTAERRSGDEEPRVARRPARSETVEDYPTTDADKYPPYETRQMARRNREEWDRTR